MRAPIAVAQNFRQLAFAICVPIPDPVEPPGTRLQLAALAGDQVAEQMEVRALKKGETASESLHNVRRGERLGEYAAPSHITGISWLHLREKVAANGRAQAVCADH